MRFPERGPGDMGREWVVLEAEKTFLEWDIPHVIIQIGPFNLVIGSEWDRRWRPLAWKTKARLRAEWESWFERIHKMNPDEAREAAERRVPR